MSFAILPAVVYILCVATSVTCAVLLARPAIERWARGAGRPLVAALARRSMTVYLWHLTAMVIVVGLDLAVLHEHLPEPWGVDWWASRPAWFGAYGLVLVVLVRAFGRFERPRSAVSGPVGRMAPAKGREHGR